MPFYFNLKKNSCLCFIYSTTSYILSTVIQIHYSVTMKVFKTIKMCPGDTPLYSISTSLDQQSTSNKLFSSGQIILPNFSNPIVP